MDQTDAPTFTKEKFECIANRLESADTESVQALQLDFNHRAELQQEKGGLGYNSTVRTDSKFRFISVVMEPIIHPEALACPYHP